MTTATGTPHDPEADPETALQTVHRLCRLVWEVNDKLFNWSDGPCDCICPDRKSDPKSWRSTGAALRFVEKEIRAAVDRALHKDTIVVSVKEWDEIRETAAKYEDLSR